MPLFFGIKCHFSNVVKLREIFGGIFFKLREESIILFSNIFTIFALFCTRFVKIYRLCDKNINLIKGVSRQLIRCRCQSCTTPYDLGGVPKNFSLRGPYTVIGFLGLAWRGGKDAGSFRFFPPNEKTSELLSPGSFLLGGLRLRLDRRSTGLSDSSEVDMSLRALRM